MTLNIFMKLSFFIIFCFQNSIQSFKNNYNPFMIYKLNNIVSNKKFSNKKAYNIVYNKKDYNKKNIFHIKKLFYNNNSNINDYYNFIKKQDNSNTTLLQDNVIVNDTVSKNGNSSEIDINKLYYLNNIYDFTNFLKNKYD